MAKKAEKNYEKYSPQYIVDKSGKKKMVLLKMEIFENLIEDLQDLSLVAERREDPKVSYEEVRKELREQGKL